jgi:hypothetical protein
MRLGDQLEEEEEGEETHTLTCYIVRNKNIIPICSAKECPGTLTMPFIMATCKLPSIHDTTQYHMAVLRTLQQNALG